jgi:hypothetical protein
MKEQYLMEGNSGKRLMVKCGMMKISISGAIKETVIEAIICYALLG